MKVLVTGGCGFIGSTLTDKLINSGYEVIVIDNLSSESHEQFYFNEKAKYYHYDICDYTNTRPLYDGVECVFHLAAESRIQSSIANPIVAIKTNTLGTGTVLQCAREANVEKVIYSSTSSAYGLKNQCPQKEDMTNDCLNPYSVSKTSGEELCKMYTRLFGLKTVIFRYFNVYGNREPIKGQYAPVVGKFLKQAKEGQPLTIVPDGTQCRDFTHVDDVVEANILAMNVEQTTYGELFNVGTGSNISIAELASLISSDQVFVEPRLAEAYKTLADNSKIKEILGWTPKVKIQDYIKAMLSS